MTRVLHVLDQPCPTGEALVLALSVDAAKCRSDEEHAWLLLGGQPMADAADAVGLDRRRYRLVPVPAGLRSLMPRVDRPARSLMMAADRVECWTAGGARFAARLACSHFVPRFGQATLCKFAEQAMDVSRVDQSQRLAIREWWGVHDDTAVVALLADRPGLVDAGGAWLAAALTRETLAAHRSPLQDVRLLCHPAVQRRVDAVTLADLLGHPQLLIQEPRLAAPWSVLTGCDIAIAPDPVNAGLSILWARAAGLPIIAPAEDRLPVQAGLDEVIAVRSGAAKHLAHALTEWIAARQPIATAADQCKMRHARRRRRPRVPDR